MEEELRRTRKAYPKRLIGRISTESDDSVLPFAQLVQDDILVDALASCRRIQTRLEDFGFDSVR